MDWIELLKFSGVVSLFWNLVQFYDSRRRAVLVYFRLKRVQGGAGEMFQVQWSLHNRGRANSVYEVGVEVYDDDYHENGQMKRIVFSKDVIVIGKDQVIVGDGIISQREMAKVNWIRIYADGPDSIRWVSVSSKISL